MRRLIVALAVLAALRVVAPAAAADAPWPDGLVAGHGMYEVTATWDGGGATVRDADWQHGVYRINLISPGGGAAVLMSVRFLPGGGYNGRLGG